MGSRARKAASHPRILVIAGEAHAADRPIKVQSLNAKRPAPISRALPASLWSPVPQTRRYRPPLPRRPSRAPRPRVCGLRSHAGRSDIWPQAPAVLGMEGTVGPVDAGPYTRTALISHWTVAFSRPAPPGP